MATVGEQLRAARQTRNVTPSRVAADLHMKVQVVEALERDDFGRMGAPVYVKGFIRVYAGYLGLDPAALLRDLPAEALRPKEEAGAPPAPRPVAASRMPTRAVLSNRILPRAWRRPAVWTALALVLTILLFVSVVRFSRHRPPPPAQPAGKAAVPWVDAAPLPDPYIEKHGATQ